jgi:hypothetical protein
MPLAALMLLAAILFAGWMQARKPAPLALRPSLSGKEEYCLSCHADLAEISPAHPVKTFGCVICHGGERLALDADLAHSTMRGGRNPSDLAVVEASCGGENCHSGPASGNRDHIQRVQTSIQSTYAGAIANLRYTFGAQPDLTARLGTSAVADQHITSPSGLPALEAFDPAKETNPLIQKFAENCLTCHINAAPREGAQYARLTGCAACHTPSVNKFAKGQVHKLTSAIPYSQCNTCHNRGNYDLRSMSFVVRNDQPTNRLQDYYQPIAQFTRCEYTLDCVDCHTRSEAMGDGDIHGSKKDIQYVQCKTCHGTLTELPLTMTISDPNDIALREAALNPVVDLMVGDRVLVTEKGEPLWNTRVMPDGTYKLVGKASGQKFSFRAVLGSTCKQKPEEQASQYCHQCHAVKR